MIKTPDQLRAKGFKPPAEAAAFLRAAAEKVEGMTRYWIKVGTIQLRFEDAPEGMANRVAAQFAAEDAKGAKP